MLQLSQEDQQTLETLMAQQYPGLAILRKVIVHEMNVLRDINNIDPNLETPVAIQALSAKMAYERLENIFRAMKVTSRPQGNKEKISPWR